ncbi:TPA: fimbrial protein [Serratia fonticola]
MAKKQVKLNILLWGVVFLMLSLSSGARATLTCVSNCGVNYTTTINKNLSATENSVGKTFISNDITIPGPTFNSIGPQTQWNVWMKFNGESVSAPGFYQRNFAYHKVDDYISVGVSWSHPCYNGGVIYAPFNIAVVKATDCSLHIVGGGVTALPFADKQVETSVRIDKKIVSGTFSRNILVAQVGWCHPGPCQSAQFFRNIYLNLNITVPQTCELNGGQVIDINFGNISSTAFKTAGAIAQGVTPQSRTISVKCDNIAGNAQLTMRLQADKTNGNVVVSDENNDVGFRVANNSGAPLIPNNLSSVIPFSLDSNARQNVTIQAYPVSVTGNKPTEGPVTSRAYLRVDFP